MNINTGKLHAQGIASVTPPPTLPSSITVKELQALHDERRASLMNWLAGLVARRIHEERTEADAKK